MKFTSGSLASVFVHGFVFFVLVIGLQKPSLEPDEPKAIQVELVPPAKKIEVKPPQKPKPIAALKPEPKKNDPDKRVIAKPLQTLVPVYKFGEKDENTNKPVKDEADRKEKVANVPPVEESTKQQVSPERTISSPSAAELESVATLIARPTKPVPRPVNPPKAVKPVKTARLRSDKKGSVSTTAKADLTRGIRAGRLCVTELRSQLNRANPPYRPDRLPTYRLDKGKVLQVNKGAFRENARWINLKFRCEIDEAATVVVAFNIEVGVPIPRSQWSIRGLPGS